MTFSPHALARQRARGRLQRQLALDFIATYTAEHGWSPTVREVADALGVGISTAHQHLRNLEGEGRISRGGGPRMIRVTVAAGGHIEVK